MLVVDAVGLALRAYVVVRAHSTLVADTDHLLAALLAGDAVDRVSVSPDFHQTVFAVVLSRRIDLLLELHEILVELPGVTGPVEDLKRTDRVAGRRGVGANV